MVTKLLKAIAMTAILTAGMAAADQTIFFPNGYDAATKLTPENSAFCWGTYKTLFKRGGVGVTGFLKNIYNYSELRKAFIQSGCLVPVATKYVAAKTMNKCFGKDYPILQLVERIKATLKERQSADAYLPWLFEYSPSLGKFAMEFGDCVTIDAGVTKIANNLDTNYFYVHGQPVPGNLVYLRRWAYPQYLATNRGTQHILRAKAKENTKPVFDMFRDGLVLEFDEKIPAKYMPEKTIGEQCKFHAISSRHQKPSAEYFAKLQQLFNKNKKKKLVLIDSRAEYAQAASKAGLVGVVCKDATQLKQDLEQLGVELV